MPVQPRTPPGVLELLPAQQIAFQRMLDTIRRGFEKFGFLPVETPVFELTEILLTKSGGETEKQVYFVQSTGGLVESAAGQVENIEDAVTAKFNREAVGIPPRELPKLALRFDLTVPLARYVAQHENELNFPFRRYQIQRVYRGERNQAGRFREFYQCDIDVIGKDSLALAYDAEMPAVIYGIFTELAFGKFTIYINNRKLLRGLLEGLGIATDKHATVLHEVDRLGKQDRTEIEQRLAASVDAKVAGRLLDLLSAHAGDSRGILAAMRKLELDNATFREGLAELERVYEGTLALGAPESALKINLSIVRGLDYYTGTVYETFLDEHPRLGSICSGGRYDNLAGHYTKSKLPGVGISIGATRLFYQLLKMNVIGTESRATAHALVLNVDPPLALEYAAIAAELRGAGLNVEVYGADDKLGKQFKYADRAGVPIAILYGTRERDARQIKIKDLRAAKEIEIPRAELVSRVKAML